MGVTAARGRDSGAPARHGLRGLHPPSPAGVHEHLDHGTAAGTAGRGWSGSLTAATRNTTEAWSASGPASTVPWAGWPTTSWTKTARAWRAGCTSTSATRSLSSAGAVSRSPCGSGCAGSAPATGQAPGRCPGSYSRTWSSRPSRPGRSRCSCYMYVIRLGVLDGRAGLRFCFFHAWYQATVDGLRAEIPPGVPCRSPVGRSGTCASRGMGKQGRRQCPDRGPPQARRACDPPDPVPGAAVPGACPPWRGGTRRRVPQQRGGEPGLRSGFRCHAGMGHRPAWRLPLDVLARRPLRGQGGLAALG